MYVAIIGNKDSGKTIFVSLLYASQIKFSEESQGDFRFYSEPKIQEILGDYFNILRGGDWPKKKFTKNINFTFGYGLSSIGHKFKRMFNKSYEKPKLSLEFGVFDVYEKIKTDEDKTVLDKTAPLLVKSKAIQSLVKSKILIILMNASRFGKDQDTDTGISKILSKRGQVGHGRFYPIIVFTKFDTIKAEKLKKLKLSIKPPEIKDDKARREYGIKLLTKYYPRIKSSLVNRDPKFYFVHIGVEKDPAGKYVPAMPSNPELEIDYSFEEYKALIEHLGEVGNAELS